MVSVKWQLREASGQTGVQPGITKKRTVQEGYSKGVSRRIFQFVAASVLFFVTLTPLANCFDTWDKGAAAALRTTPNYI